MFTKVVVPFFFWKNIKYAISFLNPLVRITLNGLKRLPFTVNSKTSSLFYQPIVFAFNDS